jgi:cytochrome c oxidase assembly factor CtaG
MTIFSHTGASASWEWDPSILIGLALLTIGYALAVGPLRRRYGWGAAVERWRQAAFYLGNLIVFVALLSPLDELGDDYLLTAHMGQHMLLMFAAPPLWLLGTPAWLVQKLVPTPRTRYILSLLITPMAAFAVFNVTMWVWHWPRLYDLALEHEGLHIVEHLTFMAAAVIGWWPVLGAWHLPGKGVSDPVRAVYLLPMICACNALSALITLSPGLLFPFYEGRAAQWGLTPQLDQQIGGLIMWMGGDMIYMTALIFVMYQVLNPTPALSAEPLSGETER